MENPVSKKKKGSTSESKATPLASENIRFLDVYPELRITHTYSLVNKRYPEHDSEVMSILYAVYSPYSGITDMDFETKSTRALEILRPPKCSFDFIKDRDIVASYINDVMDPEERALMAAKRNLDTIATLMLEEKDPNILDVRLKSNFDKHKSYDSVLQTYLKNKKSFDNRLAQNADSTTTVLSAGMNLSYRDRRFANLKK